MLCFIISYYSGNIKALNYSRLWTRNSSAFNPINSHSPSTSCFWNLFLCEFESTKLKLILFLHYTKITDKSMYRDSIKLVSTEDIAPLPANNLVLLSIYRDSSR